MASICVLLKDSILLLIDNDDTTYFINTSTYRSNTNKDFKVKAYPNPFRGTISIKTENVKGNSTIRLFDVSGKLVYSKLVSIDNDNSEFFINLPDLSNGIYYLSITNSNQTKTIKMIRN